MNAAHRAIAEYATRFHAALGPGHAAASPLSAWLMLALIAPVFRGEVRAELERVLGMPADDASEFARRLLESPHPAVGLALAAWTRPDVLESWIAGLPPAVERGAVPSQSAADSWVRAATRGRIDSLPLAAVEMTVLLFASALVAEGEWRNWFELAPADALGKSPWATSVNNVLQDFAAGAGTILRTESAGLVAAQVKQSSGFCVASVIAGPDVPQAVVMAAAHEVAASAVEVVSLYDLPLGDGHAWTITERTYRSKEPNVRTQSAHFFVPAWDVPVQTVDLMSDAAFGLPAAALGLFALLPPSDLGYLAAAKQATRARFDRDGFSAASVTVLEMRVGMARPRPPEFMATHRKVEVRFGRPYAVVAFADTVPDDPWNKVPFVSAWVTRPAEPSKRRRPNTHSEALRKELHENAEKRQRTT